MSCSNMLFAGFIFFSSVIWQTTNVFNGLSLNFARAIATLEKFDCQKFQNFNYRISFVVSRALTISLIGRKNTDGSFPPPFRLENLRQCRKQNDISFLEPRACQRRSAQPCHLARWACWWNFYDFCSKVSKHPPSSPIQLFGNGIKLLIYRFGAGAFFRKPLGLTSTTPTRLRNCHFHLKRSLFSGSLPGSICFLGTNASARWLCHAKQRLFLTFPEVVLSKGAFKCFFSYANVCTSPSFPCLNVCTRHSLPGITTGVVPWTTHEGFTVSCCTWGAEEGHAR